MTKQTTETKSKLSTRKLALIGVMTAVICIVAPFSVPLPFSPVPLSFATLSIYLAVYVLGMRDGTISLLIYLFLGAVGLPVFSGFSGGIGKLAGPTGGYLIGYIFLALISGFILDRFSGKLLFSLLGLMLGTAVCYAFGTIWLAYQLNLSFPAALTAGVLPYIPGDLAKIIIALIVGSKLKTALHKMR